MIPLIAIHQPCEASLWSTSSEASYVPDPATPAADPAAMGGTREHEEQV